MKALILVSAFLLLIARAEFVETPKDALTLFNHENKHPLVNAYGYKAYIGNSMFGLRVSFTIDLMLGYKFPVSYFTSGT